MTQKRETGWQPLPTSLQVVFVSLVLYLWIANCGAKQSFTTHYPPVIQEKPTGVELGQMVTGIMDAIVLKKQEKVGSATGTEDIL